MQNARHERSRKHCGTRRSFLTLKGPIVVVALVLAACTRIAPAPLPPAPAKSATDARAIVAQRDREVETLKAVFRLVLRKRDGTQETSRGALVVAPPDQLRLQIFSAGFVTAYDYTVNGDNFRARRPLEGLQQIGRFGEPGSDGNDLRLYDLRPLFLRRGDAASGRVEDEGAFYRVTLGSGDDRREVEVSKRRGEITGETIFSGGNPRLRARYRRYRPADHTRLPYKIEVEFPAEAVTLGIEITRYTLNEPADPQLFEIP